MFNTILQLRILEASCISVGAFSTALVKHLQQIVTFMLNTFHLPFIFRTFSNQFMGSQLDAFSP